MSANVCTNVCKCLQFGFFFMVKFASKKGTNHLEAAPTEGGSARSAADMRPPPLRGS